VQLPVGADIPGKTVPALLCRSGRLGSNRLAGWVAAPTIHSPCCDFGPVAPCILTILIKLDRDNIRVDWSPSLPLAGRSAMRSDSRDLNLLTHLWRKLAPRVGNQQARI
jgi:hypothetical protein